MKTEPMQLNRMLISATRFIRALRNGQGYIKLTTDVYRTPNGKLIHEIGVAPDIEVEQDAELVNYDIFFIMRDFANRDLQLKAAIDYLNNK